jgi:hypothetical protein
VNDAQGQEQNATAVLLGRLGTPRKDVEVGSQEAKRQGQGIQATARTKEAAALSAKMCRGPLHPDGGEVLPINEFHHFRRGRRAGKPFCRCKRCERVRRGRDPELSGNVPMIDVLPMLRVLEIRLGRAETCRRAGIGERNFWWRIDHLHYPNMHMRTFLKIKALHESVLSGNVQRDPNDIAWGRQARGHIEGLAHSRRILAEAKHDYQVPTDKWTVRNEPDKTWWVDTGMGWLPRYGAEMLGSDF